VGQNDRAKEETTMELLGVGMLVVWVGLGISGVVAAVAVALGYDGLGN
jgi:hypothetical protein